MSLPKSMFSSRRHVLRTYSAVTAGPQGVEGRLPSTFPKSHTAKNTSLVITDPYFLYQTYVQQGKLEKDEAQVRVMKEFQKLYHRLIDYRPEQEVEIKTSLLLRKIELLHAEEQRQIPSLRDEPLHKLRSWFRRDLETRRKDVVRYMTDEEELLNIPAPLGLLVSGEVGCGKSMLMDIFANSLAHHSKMRWHFNNFMLWVFGEIHQIQKESMLTAAVHGRHKLTMANEFILFEIAQRMIERSTVFMLDEFMLPDVASAQIVRILFTYYFKLGGVLVATSNKLPDELYSSEFNKSSFKSFEGILKSRCTAVHMNSSLDYREHFARASSTKSNMVVKSGDSNHDESWNVLICNALGVPGASIEEIPWEKSEITVYKRTSVVPRTFHENTVCYLEFDHVCKGLYSSSDYITLASTYKVVILDNVPIMTAKMKNEARRFITMLDALYEARCQFFIRCEDELDRLFFPEEAGAYIDRETVQQEEMFAKTAMQTMNPYRPNASSYDVEYAKEFSNADDAKAATNFGNAKAFTGEDEKFAYRRAVSRIREMVGSDHWRSCDKWVPIDRTMRPWEDFRQETAPLPVSVPDFSVSFSELKEIKETLKEQLPRELSVQYNVSFRQFNERVSPSFSNASHFWGIGEWTLDQQRKIKDKIAQKWVSGGIKK